MGAGCDLDLEALVRLQEVLSARGDLVATIEPENIGFDGTATWNLKNKDNLDIAFGVYFYVVDSPVGKKRGKIGIIK